jgi:ribose-phosphate pyrophosphokinase
VHEVRLCAIGLIVGVVTVLPVFPYSRQPDVPYVRPDTPLATAPAMLFKDSFTLSSKPSTPKASPMDPEKVSPIFAKRGPLDNVTASATMTDRSSAPGGSGLGVGNADEGRDQRWDEILEIGRQNRGNYRQWVAQAGTLVADLLTVAGTDHVITMDLHVS